MPEAIPIQEEFDDPQGGFEHYDADNVQQRFALDHQHHVNIRSFESREERVDITMIHLDIITMDILNGQTMSQLMGPIIIKPHEPWSTGTVAPQVDRNNWQGISLSCVVGTNVTQSVIAE